MYSYLFIRLCIYFSLKLCKYGNMKISYDGLWILAILVYSHTVYASLSILHCPQVGNSNGEKKIVSKCVAIHDKCDAGCLIYL